MEGVAGRECTVDLEALVWVYECARQTRAELVHQRRDHVDLSLALHEVRQRGGNEESKKDRALKVVI